MINKPTTNLPAIVQPLLVWYRQHRRDLPWRENRDPYRIWVSEIMLQQTRVEAVKEYYRRFMKELPDVRALAEISEERLLKLWEGLGYYTRARNLQKAAKQIRQEHSGKFPETFAEIRALPGIGDYTAGAISSIAFELPEPAVDGNVLRVLARIQADGRDIGDPKLKKEKTNLLKEIYPARGDCGDFTQSLMELGAIVCLPNGVPLCAQCPLQDLCKAHGSGMEQEFPVKAKKKARKKEKKTVLLLQQNSVECRQVEVQDSALAAGNRLPQLAVASDVLNSRHVQKRLEPEPLLAIRKRPEKGLLAGLWELPTMEGHMTEEELHQQLSAWLSTVEPLQTESVQEQSLIAQASCEQTAIDKPAFQIQPFGRKKHIFTHIEWDMQAWLVWIDMECNVGDAIKHGKQTLCAENDSSDRGNGLVWVSRQQLQQEYSLPTAFRQFVQKWMEQSGR